MFKSEMMLRTKIGEMGLGDHEAEILKVVRPAALIERTPAANSQLQVGASKLGGDPDVPRGFDWPVWDRVPLTFIAQFDLEEVAEALNAGDGNPLPKSGLLSFFFEADSVPFGERDQRDGWRIYYFDVARDRLEREDHPTVTGGYGPIGALPAHSVTFERRLTLPGFGDVETLIPQINTDAQYDAYDALLTATDDGSQHFLLGYPRLIQGPVEWEAAAWSREDQIQNPSEGDIAQWRFLFQIDSDNSLGVMWGDLGTLYVLMTEDALATREFDAAWTIMQCS